MVALTLATLLMGGFAVIVRFGQRQGGDAVTIGAANYLVAALCFVPFLRPFPFPHVMSSTLGLGALGGVVYASAYFLMLPVLRDRGVAITSACLRLSVVIPMLLSLLLWQETPTLLQSLGALLAVVALALLVIGHETTGGRRADGLASFLVVALFVMNGGCASIGKWYHVTGLAAERPVFFATLFGVAGIYASLVWLLWSRRFTYPDLALGIGLGVVNAGANFALLAALDHFSGVVVFPVTGAGGLVVAVMFAAVAWRERPNSWGMAGIGLAMIAVLIVNLAPTNGKPLHRMSWGTKSVETAPFSVLDRSQSLRPGSYPLQERQAMMSEVKQDLSGLWDLQAVIHEPLRMQVVRTGASGWGAHRVRTREVRYYSHNWAEGEVIIAAYIALPATDAPVPAMVMGTGDAKSGEEFCRTHRVATVVIDRPGVGQSTGPEDDYSNWVRFTDPRESWMWHYVNAALRAVTLATTLPEVDPNRIGITGSSRGGTMAWIANGVDPRLKLAVPVATGGDIIRALDHGGWANYLHRDETGNPYIPDEFYTFARYYDPLHYAGRQHGAVMLIVGAQDEYFPLFCTATSAMASAQDEFRLLIIVNWDHGYFSTDNPLVEAFDNSVEAHRKQELTVAAAIDTWLRGSRSMPNLPTLHVQRLGERLECSISSCPDKIESVTVHVSFDGAYTFDTFPAHLEEYGYVAEVVAPDSGALELAAVFAEVEYEGGPILTSIPWFGSAFQQRMRPFPEPEE
ncbi:MAG: EamA family transporter [Candidatus Zipacnadales bacterium]